MLEESFVETARLNFEPKWLLLNLANKICTNITLMFNKLSVWDIYNLYNYNNCNQDLVRGLEELSTQMKEKIVMTFSFSRFTRFSGFVFIVLKIQYNLLEVCLFLQILYWQWSNDRTSWMGNVSRWSRDSYWRNVVYSKVLKKHPRLFNPLTVRTFTVFYCITVTQGTWVAPRCPHKDPGP